MGAIGLVLDGDIVRAVTRKSVQRGGRGRAAASAIEAFRGRVTLDTQTKSYDGVDVGEARGWAVGGDIDGRMRVRIKRVFSLDVMTGRIRAKFRRIRQLTNSTANKGYSGRKITGDVTRFEYDSAYPLTVTTRDLSGHVLIAKSWELSGPEYWTAVTVAHEHVPKRPYTTDEILELAAVEVRDVSVVPDPGGCAGPGR